MNEDLDRTEIFDRAEIGRLAACLGYTVLVTTGPWFLLSGTDAVVHGSMAVAHIVVWSGFALFIGIFFGFIAKQA